MVNGSVFDTQAKGSDFTLSDINAGAFGIGGCFDAVFCQGGDDAVFKCGNDVADTGFTAFEIDHRIDDQLAGAVIGNLTASVNLDNGNIVADEEVFGFSGQALGKYGRMFDHP